MRIFKNKIIFFVFFLRSMRPGGIIEVPQIWLSLRPPIFNSRIYTDFFAACAAEDKRGTQMTQMTQIFPSSYPQMRPIRSDDTDFPDSTVHLLEKVFSTPLSPSAKRGSLSHSQALALTIRARDVAGDAIALPEFWSASGACALKGWLRVLTQ